MAQQTEVEAAPNSAAASPPSETHSAAAPPVSHRQGFFRARPQARMYLIVAIVILLVAGFFAWRYFSSYESTDDAQIDGHLMPISARISGYVDKVTVDDNQYVQAGSVLGEIDPRDFQV